ncbi:enoyl-CoA hydratase/isomerase family protein, partial [bacterium]|nr:enoyl-CoA hydratase/isomerase family protein [bacterium]
MPVRQQYVGPVLVVTLDEPQTRQALSAAVIASLHALFRDLAAREPLPPGAAPDVADRSGTGGRRPRVVVLRASGAVFCAGAHLGEMAAAGRADLEANLAAATRLGEMFRAVHDCPAPVVARVQGGAFGGGAGLAAACDVVVAGPAARFCFSETRLGLVPGVISPLVVERTGPARARDLFLTARAVDAAEAARLGLVDRLAAAGGLDAAVEAVVDDLLKAGPAALGEAKRLLADVVELGYEVGAETCAERIAAARATP